MRPIKFKNGKVYICRQKLNPAATERLNQNIERGWYKHDHTSGDVEAYTITPSCPFSRKDPTAEQKSTAKIIKELISLAANKEFDAFCDGVNELAYACKAMGKLNAEFLNIMQAIESRASQKSGNPFLAYEIRKHLELHRQKRTGSVIVV